MLKGSVTIYYLSASGPSFCFTSAMPIPLLSWKGNIVISLKFSRIDVLQTKTKQKTNKIKQTNKKTANRNSDAWINIAVKEKSSLLFQQIGSNEYSQYLFRAVFHVLFLPPVCRIIFLMKCLVFFPLINPSSVLSCAVSSARRS